MKNKIKAGSECKYKPTQKEMWDIACLCVQLYGRIFPQVYKFVNANKRAPAEAIIKTLKAIAQYKPNAPWAYGVKVLDIESGKFFAERNMAEGEKFKKEEKEGLAGFKNILREIMGK